MTRINVVPVEELTDKHLRAEYREITRVFTLVKKAVGNDHTPGSVDIPKDYVLGPGHVKFFYNKLLYVKKRYEELYEELKRRGGGPSAELRTMIVTSAMINIPKGWWNDYTPTEVALRLNRQRIAERIRG